MIVGYGPSTIRTHISYIIFIQVFGRLDDYENYEFSGYSQYSSKIHSLCMLVSSSSEGMVGFSYKSLVV